MKKWSAAELFHQMWPDVGFENASEADRRLFENHADSLNYYNETRNSGGNGENFD